MAENDERRLFIDAMEQLRGMFSRNGTATNGALIGHYDHMTPDEQEVLLSAVVNLANSLGRTLVDTNTRERDEWLRGIQDHTAHFVAYVIQADNVSNRKAPRRLQLRQALAHLRKTGDSAPFRRLYPWSSDRPGEVESLWQTLEQSRLSKRRGPQP